MADCNVLCLSVGVLSLEHAAAAVSVLAEAGGSGAFFVASLSEAAELYLWRCSPTAPLEAGGAAADGAGRRVQSHLLARISVGATRWGPFVLMSASMSCSRLKSGTKVLGSCATGMSKFTSNEVDGWSWWHALTSPGLGLLSCQ